MLEVCIQLQVVIQNSKLTSQDVEIGVPELLLMWNVSDDEFVQVTITHFTQGKLQMCAQIKFTVIVIVTSLHFLVRSKNCYTLPNPSLL